MKPIHALLFISAVVLAAPVAKADDPTARQLLAKAQALYDKRGDTIQNSIDAASTLETALTQVQSADLKYDILILETRSLYWQGTHTDGDDNKKVIHLKAKAQADAAIALDDSYAEGQYYAGINLARWAEANGIVASISHKGELIQYMKNAADVTRTTRDGQDGETVDGYGPDRVLGRMYQKLPGILGGDHNLAVTYLRTAVAKAPKHAINVVYLADSLYKGSSAEQAEGKQIVTALLQNDPTVFGQADDRVPETLDEFQWARDLLNGKPVP
jgi:hypothetical protein